MVDSRISVAAGFCSGIAETLIGHPFDTIKTKLQTQSVDRVGERPLYKSPLHCFFLTIKKDGIKGLYRGVLSPILQNALGAALLFGAMDWFRENTGANIFSPFRFVFACFVIGSLESLLYCPLDHIKARMQVEGGKKVRRVGSGGEKKSAAEEQIHSGLRIMNEVISVRGIFGLYYGYIFQFLKETTGNVALFGTYDLVLFLLGEELQGRGGRGGSKHAHPEALHWLHVWPAGSLAGMAYYLVGYPFDTMKSLLQTDSLSFPRYKGPLHALVCILNEKNWRQEMYRGLSVCLLRAIPGSAVQFVVFESVVRILTVLTHLHVAIKPHLANLEHFGDIEHLI